jgi:hypothetical protein
MFLHLQANENSAYCSSNFKILADALKQALAQLLLWVVMGLCVVFSVIESFHVQIEYDIILIRKCSTWSKIAALAPMLPAAAGSGGALQLHVMYLKKNRSRHIVPVAVAVHEVKNAVGLYSAIVYVKFRPQRDLEWFCTVKDFHESLAGSCGFGEVIVHAAAHATTHRYRGKKPRSSNPSHR